MTKSSLFLIAFYALAACDHRPTHYEVKLQDGTPGYRLDCDRNEFTDRECVNEAVRLCGGGAEISGGSNNGSYSIVRCAKK